MGIIILIVDAFNFHLFKDKGENSQGEEEIKQGDELLPSLFYELISEAIELLDLYKKKEFDEKAEKIEKFGALEENLSTPNSELALITLQLVKHILLDADLDYTKFDQILEYGLALSPDELAGKMEHDFENNTDINLKTTFFGILLRFLERNLHHIYFKTNNSKIGCNIRKPCFQ